MSAHIQQLQQANLLTGRQMVLVVTIALHALVISALMSIRNVPSVKLTQEVDPVWVEPYKPPPENKPQPADLKLDPLPSMVIVLPPVDLVIDFPGNTALTAESSTNEAAPEATTDVAPGPTGTGTVEAPTVPQTALQYRIVRPTDDYYPAASLSLQESGTAIVNVCVGPSGQLEGAPTIERSSGSRRLDAAAQKWAREALRFTPATRGGTPVSACKGFRVNFQLH